MSQAGVLNIATNSPTVATSYVTDSGTAIPAANVLNVLGGTDINTSAVGNTITIAWSGAVGSVNSITATAPLTANGMSGSPQSGNVTMALTTPLVSQYGGTGVASPTAHTLPVAEGASAFTFLGPLTNGQLLIGSTGADPVPATLTAGTGISISNGAGSISISVTGGGPVNSITATAPLTANGASGSAQTGAVTVALTTPLALQYGGTNANLTASNGGIFYSTATAGAILSGTATANQVLLSGSSAAPAWSTATYPATTTINQVLYSSANNVIGGITASNNGVLISGTTGIPSWLAAGTTGQVLSATTGSPPSWVNLSSFGVTSITGTANQISASASTGAVTLSFTNGISIGSYQATTSPTGGIICPGKVGFGTSSILSDASYEFVSTNSYNLYLTGTQTSVDASQYARVVLISGTLNPTNGATGVLSGLHVGQTFIAPSAKTISIAAGIYMSNIVSSNVGTITDYYGMWIDGGSGSAGTVTNAYGLKVSTPAAGSGIRVGEYISCIDSVGAAGTRYGLWVDGTMTGDDGTFEKAIYCPVTMRPTTDNRSAYGGWFTPYVQPFSTNTIPNAVAVYAFCNGTAGTGTISNGYSLYLDSPAVGTNRLGAFFNGADSAGTTPGTRYLVAIRGTITGDDGANCIGLLNDARLQPTSNSRATYGMYLTPNANPNSTNTISSAIGAFIQSIGTAASGTITFASSLQVNSPTIGSTRWGFNVVGADADGNSPGCQKLIVVNGTITGDDGSSEYGFVHTPSMRPTNTSRSTYGFYCAPYGQPHSTNTIDAHYGGAFIADGTAGSGAVTFGISLRAYNPNVGTTKIALYADNVAIGTATAPPSSGIYCIGQSYFGNGAVQGTVNSVGHQISYQSINTGVDVGFGGTNAVGCLNLSVASLTANITTAAAFMAYPGLYVDGTHTLTNACGYFSKVYTGGSAGTITNLCGFYFSANGGTGTIVNNYGYYAEGPTSGGTLNANFYANGSSSSQCFYANVSSGKTGFYAKCPDTTTDAFFTQDGTNNGVAIRNDSSNGITFYGYQNSITLLAIDKNGAITASNGPIRGDRLASNSTPSATSGTLRTAPGDTNGSPSFSVSTSTATWQNTNDYDVLITCYATSTSGAVFSVGVGTTSSPTVHAASPSLSSGVPFFFSLYVPASYYAKVSVGAGTLTVAGHYSAV